MTCEKSQWGISCKISQESFSVKFIVLSAMNGSFQIISKFTTCCLQNLSEWERELKGLHTQTHAHTQTHTHTHTHTYNSQYNVVSVA